MTIRLVPVFCLLIMLIRIPGHAQKINYTITHYTSDNGLPQNSIKSIFKDTEGFMWMGTEDGLARYDGNRFAIFNSTNLHIKNTRSIFIQPVLRTDNKQAYVPAGSTAVSYAFFYLSPPVKIEKGTAVPDTVYYLRDHKQLEPFKKETPDLFQSTGLPNFLSDNIQLRRYLIRSGNTDNDFFICDNTHFTSYINWKPKYSHDFPANNLWNYFVIGPNLYYFQEKTAAITMFSPKTTKTVLISGDILKNPVFQTRKKSIRIYWNNVADQIYLCLDKNLYILSLPETSKTEQPGAHINAAKTTLLVEDFDFKSEGIEEIYYNKKNKQVFLGSGTTGLFILTEQLFQTINIKGDFRDNVFYSQVPYDKNSVLTSDGRIVGRDFATGKTIDKFEALIYQLNGVDKFSILADKNGDIWTKRGSILFHFNKTKEKLLGRWNFKYNVEAMHQDVMGRIWLGSNDEGLYYLDPADPAGKPRLFLTNPFLRITTIKSRLAGHLLVGTHTGLFTVDINLKKALLIAGTEGLHIKSIYQDSGNNTWITALQKGILLLTPKGSIVTFPLDKNLYLASPHCIVNDNRGFFWIPTNTGLFQVASKDLLKYAELVIANDSKIIKQPVPTELFYNFHTKNEGFNTNEFNGSCDPCGIRLQNGYISLPSLNGLVWFKPEKLTTNEPDGNIILDKAEVNHKLLAAAHDTLYFPLDPGRVRLQFATVYSGNHYNLNLSYALVKENHAVLPTDWSPIRNDDFTIEFSSLNSGNYTLLVRKLNGFGINNYTIKKIFFVVPLFWYQTWWAISLLIMAFLLMIYSFIIYRLKKVMLKNEKLEEMIVQRTKSLELTLDALEKSKTRMSGQMQVMATLLASISHDVQSPLFYISYASEEIEVLVKTEDLHAISKIGVLISDVSKRTANMLLDLLNYLKINVYGEQMSFEMINLSELIDEKLAIFKTTISSNNSHYVNDIPADTKVCSDPQMLSIMIHNLVDNASKYTYKGEIRFYVQINDKGNTELVISNSGQGLSPQLIEIINNKSTERNQEKPMQRTSGLGLLIVKEIADMIGVVIRVKQTDHSVFYLEFYG